MVAQVDASNPTSKAVAPSLALQGTLQIFTGPDRAFSAGVIAHALRAAGQGVPVLVVQFLKGGIGQGPDSPMYLCQGLRWVRCNLHRCLDTPHLEIEEQKAMYELWKYTRRAVHSGRFGLVVLDELSLAIQFGLIPETEVVELLEQRPSYMDVILTGPEMPLALSAMADQVTELRKSVIQP
ncbi:MAG: P-loop NTPase family protein [Aphanocapsa lilacina HA4352-LM1]|jgi:cob(I)alamin adenosyltransferase|nr:P-loop NTPase family protein [Aphanocapsa lilacina HA4352-LM1]